MYYHRQGNIPPKRHTQFRQPDGSLYKEDYPPTRIKKVNPPERYGAKRVENYELKQTHLNTSKVTTTGEDYLAARKVLMMNNDCSISICSPRKRKMDYFYKNAEGDEVIYVHDGKGTLTSPYGKLDLRQGDYIVIPRTVIYKLEFEEGPLRLLIIESLKLLSATAMILVNCWNIHRIVNEIFVHPMVW